MDGFRSWYRAELSAAQNIKCAEKSMDPYLKIFVVFIFFFSASDAGAANVQDRFKQTRFPAQYWEDARSLFDVLFGVAKPKSDGDNIGSRTQANRPLVRNLVQATTSCSGC